MRAIRRSHVKVLVSGWLHKRVHAWCVTFKEQTPEKFSDFKNAKTPNYSIWDTFSTLTNTFESEIPNCRLNSHGHLDCLWKRAVRSFRVWLAGQQTQSKFVSPLLFLNSLSTSSANTCNLLFINIDLLYICQ